MSDESGKLYKGDKNGSFNLFKEFNLGDIMETLPEGTAPLEFEQVRDWRKMKDDDMWERKREKLRQQQKKASGDKEEHPSKKAKVDGEKQQ
jgi:hypothetical protein